MLQVIISPAKQMQVRADAFAPRGIPPFPSKTRQLVDALRTLEREQGAEGLKALWRVNDKLLAENIERLHEFEPVMDEFALDDPAVARLVGPAVFSYVGIQYRSMAPDVLGLDALEWLEAHLWVLSGLYGCVRPFDAVQPYRLEMGVRLAVDGARDLYRFWGADIAGAIEGAGRGADRHRESAGVAAGGNLGIGAANGCNEDAGELDDGEGVAANPRTAGEVTAAEATEGTEGDAASGEAPCIVNLASVEYAKAILPRLSPSTRIVTCIFGEELRNGKPVQRATASKIARGSMVRWMAENEVEEVRELERFDVGYAFAPDLSTADADARERTLVFIKR